MSDDMSVYWKDYVDQRFSDMDKAVLAALSSTEKAITVANAANEKRLDAVNEFRDQQKDIIAGFLSRVEYQAQHEAVLSNVARNRDDLAALTSVVVPRFEIDAGRKQLTDLLIPLQDFVTAQRAFNTATYEGKNERRLDLGQVLQILTTSATLVTLIVLFISLLVTHKL